jgi:acetate kinase
MRLLVVNVGSSSLKLRLLGDRDDVIESADLSAEDPGTDDSGPARALRGWPGTRRRRAPCRARRHPPQPPV